MNGSLVVFLLAAGFGTRLRPYTDQWPKCLMPINGRPLLEYWLNMAKLAGAKNVLVNLHYLSETVAGFLKRKMFKNWVQAVYEPELKGTAGALCANYEKLQNATVMLVHADNYCDCDLENFIEFHFTLRPKNCVITMMVFNAQNPSSCGIVELDQHNVVIGFHEKIDNPPGTLANGAVYLIEPEVLDWVYSRDDVTDFSTQVLPHFIGRIATWRNTGIHVDIGSIEALHDVQSLPTRDMSLIESVDDDWARNFASHPIHQQIQCGVHFQNGDNENS